MPKSRFKKKSLKSKLTWIFIALAIFLGGSVYAALQTGTGPLSFLSKTPDINRITKCTEDPACVDLIVQSAERGVIVTNVSNLTTTQAATQIKNNTTNIKLKTDEDKEFVEEITRLTKTKTEKVDQGGQTTTPIVDSAPTNLTPAAGNKPESCAGGNGVKLTPGKYAATGHSWQGEGRNDTPDLSRRECVLIDVQCNHGKPVACDVVYNIDPSSVILPTFVDSEHAGSEYYAGKTPAQIREDEKNNIAPPPKPKENCYDKSGVIMVTGSQLGSDRCFNGEFISEGDFDTENAKTCNPSTQTYNIVTNNCDLLPPPPPGGNTPPNAPTPQEIQAKKDECRGNSKEYDATKNDCTQETLKCGPDYRYREGFCDLAPDSASEPIRDQIFDSAKKFCDDINKKFDPSTGLCQAPTPGRPWECKSEQTYTSDKKLGYRFCVLDDTGRVVGERYQFCDSTTSTYDSKTGICTPKSTNLNPPANPAATGKSDGGQEVIDVEKCPGGKGGILDKNKAKYICNNSDGSLFDPTLAGVSQPNNQNLTPLIKGGQEVTDVGTCPGGRGGILDRSKKKYICNNSDGSLFDPTLANIPGNNILGSLKPGQICNGGNKECISNDCRFISKPGDSNRNWYCIGDVLNSSNNNPNLRSNGEMCFGESDQCASGYCADIIGLDRCATNPFE